MPPHCTLRRRASVSGKFGTEALTLARGLLAAAVCAALVTVFVVSGAVSASPTAVPSARTAAQPSPAAPPRPPVHVPGASDWWGGTVGNASPTAAFLDRQLVVERFALQWISDALTLLFTPPPAMPERSASRGYAHGSSTGACGGASNGADQYIGRESGGDPGAVNQSSGAYGCYQIMPGTWSASCSELGAESGSSAATQAQCASRLPGSAWAG